MEDKQAIINQPAGSAEDSAGGSAAGARSKTRGLTILTAAVFIAGEMAGSGVLSLPRAVENSGWIGLVLILLCCWASGFTGVLLGRCWNMLQHRFPKYREHIRYPYPAIAEESFGRYARWTVSFSINFTLFGVSAVFLLIASSNVSSLISQAGGKNISFCVYIIIIAACLCPITWLGTPKDFWFIAVGAMTSTAFACLFMTVAMVIESGQKTADVQHNPPTFKSFFLSFGVILFAFGGHATFPTIQHDMVQPTDFYKSVFWAYLVIVLMYLPVSSSGYLIFGNDLADNVLVTALESDLATTAATALLNVCIVLITLHLLFGFVIVINPLCQEFEEFLRLPKHFCWQRCVLRTSVMCAVLFATETVPHFGSILSLVGGSTVTLLTFVFPSIFYIKLCSGAVEGDEDFRQLKVHDKAINYCIIGVGVFGGFAATYASISGLAQPNAFSLPCYVSTNITAG